MSQEPREFTYDERENALTPEEKEKLHGEIIDGINKLPPSEVKGNLVSSRFLITFSHWAAARQRLLDRAELAQVIGHLTASENNLRAYKAMHENQMKTIESTKVELAAARERNKYLEELHDGYKSHLKLVVMNDMYEMCMSAIKERDALKAERDVLIEQAQTFDVIGRDEAYAEVDRLRKKVDALQAERDALKVERDALALQTLKLNVELNNKQMDLGSLQAYGAYKDQCEKLVGALDKVLPIGTWFFKGPYGNSPEFEDYESACKVFQDYIIFKEKMERK